MCGPAAIPVLKFIAPMVLPSLAQRIFGGGNKQGDAQPAFKQTAAPGTKLAGAQSQLGDDEEKKEEITAQETDASKTAKLRKIRQADAFSDTKASSIPFADAITAGENLVNQNRGGINPGTTQPAGGF